MYFLSSGVKGLIRLVAVVTEERGKLSSLEPNSKALMRIIQQQPDSPVVSQLSRSLKISLCSRGGAQIRIDFIVSGDSGKRGLAHIGTHARNTHTSRFCSSGDLVLRRETKQATRNVTFNATRNNFALTIVPAKDDFNNSLHFALLHFALNCWCTLRQKWLHFGLMLHFASSITFCWGNTSAVGNSPSSCSCSGFSFLFLIIILPFSTWGEGRGFPSSSCVE